jgi:hypothetical protein
MAREATGARAKAWCLLIHAEASLSFYLVMVCEATPAVGSPPFLPLVAVGASAVAAASVAVDQGLTLVHFSAESDPFPLLTDRLHPAYTARSTYVEREKVRGRVEASAVDVLSRASATGGGNVRLHWYTMSKQSGCALTVDLSMASNTGGERKMTTGQGLTLVPFSAQPEPKL